MPSTSVYLAPARFHPGQTVIGPSLRGRHAIDCFAPPRVSWQKKMHQDTDNLWFAKGGDISMWQDITGDPQGDQTGVCDDSPVKRRLSPPNVRFGEGESDAQMLQAMPEAMSFYVSPPTPQTVEGFASKIPPRLWRRELAESVEERWYNRAPLKQQALIDKAWEAVTGESQWDEGDQHMQLSARLRVFPELSLKNSYGRPWLGLEHGTRIKPQDAAIPELASAQGRGRLSKLPHQRTNRAKESFSEPPPSLASRTTDAKRRPGGGPGGARYDGKKKKAAGQGSSDNQESADGIPDGDLSESPISVDDGGGYGRGSDDGRSQRLASLASATLEPSPKNYNTPSRAITVNGTLSPGRGGSVSAAKRVGGTHNARPPMVSSNGRTIAISKSESCLPTANKKRGFRLPGVEHGGASNPKRRARNRDLRLPPPGGHRNTTGNALMKEIEAQIEGLRTSPGARRALEARVWRHLSQRPRRRARHRRHLLDDASLGSIDSAGSLASTDSTERETQVDHPDVGSSLQEHSASAGVRGEGNAGAKGDKEARGRLPLEKSAESTSVSERLATQMLHAQAVLRRKRAIEEERIKQARQRSEALEEEARRPRDRRAEKRRAQMLITIVYCAIALAEWKMRYAQNKEVHREARRQEAGARILQRCWRMSRVRRTLARVRECTPAVRAIVFRMRLKAAVAKEVVARRHRTQAADLIRAMLRAGTRTLFRTRISFYIERIIVCQRMFTSYREVTKARKRVLTNKWKRGVQKLDDRRFTMYSANLRDMYNFDPAAVERFLKEMRVLAAKGQTAAQAMKSKQKPSSPGNSPAHTVGNGRASGTAAAAAAAAAAADGDTEAESAAAELSEEERANNAASGVGKGDGGAWGGQRRGPTRATRGNGGPAVTPRITTAASRNAPKRPKVKPKVKLAAGWQKRVVHAHRDIEVQAALMCRRGVKHKEISRALRKVLISELLDHARREHRNWCWNHVVAAREKERQTAVINTADIRSALRTDSPSPDGGLLEAKIKALAAREEGALPFNRLKYMLMLTMITDELLTRCIILAERIEGCVAADASGRGFLSPEEIEEIFVVNRHPSQHETAAAKEAKGELQAWASGRGLVLPLMKRSSTSKAASYHLHHKTLEGHQSEKERQVPYFDFMSAVKGGILLDLSIPEGQRLAAIGRTYSMSVSKTSHPLSGAAAGFSSPGG